MKTRVLVTGANGQLGQCLQELAPQLNFEFTFHNSSTLDITSKDNISLILNSTFDFCVNCAAYTAVDKAEEEFDNANKINHIGVKFLAEACLKNNIVLIHISTDFVFNGQKHNPYNEEDETNPISVYGKTKRDGEKAIQNILTKYFIIRTSWLYSQYGHNFVKSMLTLAKTRNTLSVVDDQIGSPTYAVDLAHVIIVFIKQNNYYGLYHYSNQDTASWYDFAKAIFTKSNTIINLEAIPTSSYPTKAKRPQYSVLNKTKLIKTFNIEVPHWEKSLERCLKAFI